MKIKDLFAKRMRVADNLTLPVSRHFFYSLFGVRGRYDNVMRTGNYICSGTPGTGFFAHSSESHSYHKFVSESKAKLKQTPLTLILGKEPDFDKEKVRIEQAINSDPDPEKKRILSHYVNVVTLAKEEELLQRIVRAIKDRIGNKPNQYLVSILSHYKSSIATLEHDVRAAQINVQNNVLAEHMLQWEKVVNAFHLIISSRRVWSVFSDGGEDAYQQVFFDLGIFDYIQSPYDTPVMRDHDNIHYYLYPQGIIKARSSVDFDCMSWDNIDVEFNVVDISTLAVRPQFNGGKKKKSSKYTDALSTLYGTTRTQVVGEFSFPQLKLRFFTNHTGPAKDFVDELNSFLGRQGNK